LRKVASKTITDPVQMRAEIQKIRTQGYAFDDQEFHDDMRCLAVPVYEKGGIVQAGISLSGPSSRFTMAKLKELNIEAEKVSRALSKKFGGMS
jgi:DNA-binding IclR family transcriptional regulator